MQSTINSISLTSIFQLRVAQILSYESSSLWPMACHRHVVHSPHVDTRVKPVIPALTPATLVQVRLQVCCDPVHVITNSDYPVIGVLICSQEFSLLKIPVRKSKHITMKKQNTTQTSEPISFYISYTIGQKF